MNATRAAVRAGYSGRTAQQQASRMLLNVVVQGELQRLMAERSARVEITADRVLRELVEMALYDPGIIAGEKITCPDDIARLPENVRRAIVGWSWDRGGNFIIRLAGKAQALDMIGQHLGMWKNRVELTGPDGGPVQTQTEFRPTPEDEAFLRKVADIRAGLRGESQDASRAI